MKNIDYYHILTSLGIHKEESNINIYEAQINIGRKLQNRL